MTDNTNKHGASTFEESSTGCTNTSCCPPKSPITRSAPKIGRNDPCHCGSEVKFKKCCGKN